MKKILCFSLAILILTISILVYCPLGVFASYPDDYFSLSKPYTDSMGLSSLTLKPQLMRIKILLIQMVFYVFNILLLTLITGL